MHFLLEHSSTKRFPVSYTFLTSYNYNLVHFRKAVSLAELNYCNAMRVEIIHYRKKLTTNAPTAFDGLVKEYGNRFEEERKSKKIGKYDHLTFFHLLPRNGSFSSQL